MNLSQKPFLIFSILLLLIIAGFFLFKTVSKTLVKKTPAPQAPVMKDNKVKYPVDYLIVLVGDSMTEALGNSDELKEDLINYYPNKTFDVLNYGFGSTNILSLQKRLEEKTFNGREFRPITDIDFDLILIESFGHNPLSQFPLEEGLRKQTESLEKAVQTIKAKNPKAKIVFVATIAPSMKNYGRGQVDLSDQEREKWAKEREAYIKNHIKYAVDHNIPIINVFEKSKIYGDLDLEYVRTEDYIHPSPKGVIFISKEIADFIFKNKILE